MDGIELVATVVRVSRPEKVKTRFGDAERAVAQVRDETGTISLKLWREQVRLVRAGDTVKLEGAFAVEFGGELELNVGSRGRIITIKRGC